MDHRHNLPRRRLGSAKPGYLTTLGYSARWGIEPMFSDFKSRGFGLEQTHIQYPDRLARLILVMSLALLSLSKGLGGLDRHVGPRQQPNPGRKKRPERQPAKLARSKLSWFTRGIRRAIKLLLQCLPLPSLWGCLLN